MSQVIINARMQLYSTPTHLLNISSLFFSQMNVYIFTEQIFSDEKEHANMLTLAKYIIRLSGMICAIKPALDSPDANYSLVK